MTAMRFVDTNILIYAVSVDDAEAEKTRRARELLERSDLAVSVFQEFYVQATRTNRTGALSHSEAVRYIASLRRCLVQAMTLEVFDSALEIRERFGLAYWDSAILAAAKACGCEAVYSEDLNADQDYDGLRVVNPFV